MLLILLDDHSALKQAQFLESSPILGTVLGPYQLLSPIGSGGMGEVYRARDTRLDRTVAIKVLPQRYSADAAVRQRFEREAKAISALQHPNICTLYDIGRQDNTDCLVMEFLEGQTLAARLTQGTLPPLLTEAGGGPLTRSLPRRNKLPALPLPRLRMSTSWACCSICS